MVTTFDNSEERNRTQSGGFLPPAALSSGRPLTIALPGAYALTAYSQDELVARLGLTQEKPDCVIIAGYPNWSPAMAAALMIFVLLYAPCFVTLVVMKQEAGSWKWAAFSLAFNTLLAFVAAAGVYQAGLLILSS